MIARLVLTESGPALLRPRSFGPPRRLVVVVSDELSTAAPPHAWPTPTHPSNVLVARVGTSRLYARTTLGETAIANGGLPEAGHLLRTIVPEQAVRARRPPRERGRRARRPRRLALFAFRDAATSRRRLRTAALGAVLAGALALGSVALRSHAASAHELAALEAERLSLHRARATVAELDLETTLLQADGEVAGSPRVAPAQILSRIARTLEPGELVRSFRVSEDRLTVVVSSARGLAVARSIGALDGVGETSGSLHDGDDDATVIVQARAGAAR